MKRLLLLGFLSISILKCSFAIGSASILNLSLHNRQNFYFTIDGQNFPMAYQQRIENLRPGYHSISAYTLHRKHYGFVNKLIYQGSIYINPATETFVELLPGQMHVMQVVNLFNQPNHCVSNAIYSAQPLMNSCELNVLPMNDLDFSDLLRTLDRTSFDSNKQSILKQVLRTNYFTSNQVREILSYLSFESSRLEFAKAAFSKTVDQNKYFIVNDAFSFSSSTHELNQFIASR